jgi:hypothetical protein
VSDGIDPEAANRPEGLDPAETNRAEDLDEDRLKLDPLEAGMDPPEHWTQADRWGSTGFEQTHREDLEHRLREEQPDDPADLSVDDEWEDPAADEPADVDVVVEPLPPDESLTEDQSDAVRRGQSADEAGGSVAESIRTPPDRRRS